MSMWLGLAKISPQLLAELRAEPKLTERLFFESDDGNLPGVDDDADIFGYDYRILTAAVDAEDEDEDEDEELPEVASAWMDKAINGAGEVLEYDFCYGPGFTLSPEQVTEIAAGLAADGLVGVMGDDTEDDLGLFYAAAAREGKAVVGGIS